MCQAQNLKSTTSNRNAMLPNAMNLIKNDSEIRRIATDWADAQNKEDKISKRTAIKRAKAALKSACELYQSVGGNVIAATSLNNVDGVQAFGKKELTSANIENLPKKWVKHVQLGELSEEARNRISLGCGGQRYLQALSYLGPDDDDFNLGTETQQAYIAFLLNWTKGHVYWDLHPIFKSSLVTSTRPALYFPSLKKFTATNF